MTSLGGWRRTPSLRSSPALSPTRLFLCAGRQAAQTRRDGVSGRVRRREGRERRLRSGRLLHASPHHPQAAVVGKLNTAMCGSPSMDGPTCRPPSLPLSSIHIVWVSLPLFVLMYLHPNISISAKERGASSYSSGVLITAACSEQTSSELLAHSFMWSLFVSRLS